MQTGGLQVPHYSVTFRLPNTRADGSRISSESDLVVTKITCLQGFETGQTDSEGPQA